MSVGKRSAASSKGQAPPPPVRAAALQGARARSAHHRTPHLVSQANGASGAGEEEAVEDAPADDASSAGGGGSQVRAHYSPPPPTHTHPPPTSPYPFPRLQTSWPYKKRATLALIEQAAGDLTIRDFDDGPAADRAARSIRRDYADWGGPRAVRNLLVSLGFRKCRAGEIGTPTEAIQERLVSLGLPHPTLGKVLAALGISHVAATEGARTGDPCKHAHYDITDAPWGEAEGEGGEGTDDSECSAEGGEEGEGEAAVSP